MTKKEFINERTKIISDMLDNPSTYGIFPTTKCFAALDDLFDKICIDFGQQPGEPSGAQKRLMKKPKGVEG